MRAYVLQSYGSPGKAELADVPIPEMKPGDLLIGVKAAGLNPVDFKTRDGKLRLVQGYVLPIVMGNECSGIVEKTGPDVSRFKAGDSVFLRCEKDRMGAFADYVSADQSVAAHISFGLSFAQAAALPLAGLTSLQALRDALKVGPSYRLFISGGAGGVGTFAIQIAKSLGAHVTTTASPRGEALVRSLGADVVIDYTKEDFSADLREMDGMFDLIGGETLLKGFDVVRKGGTVVSVAGPPEPVTARKDLNRGLGLQALFWLASRKERAAAKAAGVTYRFLFMRPSGADLDILAAMIDVGTLKVTVDRELPFNQIAEGFAHLESGRAKGKVVVTL